MCVYVHSYSWMFWVAEGLRPGSVPTLEAATPAASQPLPTAADGLVKSALFKSVAELQSALILESKLV